MNRQTAFPALLLFSFIVSAAELPVRQVVLYKHGIGFFERSGTLAPGETARLDFKASEMNDVLKSLTVEEKGGGKVSGLRYDSSIPLERKLADYPFHIGSGQGLAAILDQLRGARIELQFGTEKAVGSIVGARSVPAAKDAPEREQITLMLDSGDLRTYDLAASANIRFSDGKLQAQFKDYLTAVSDARSSEKRSVYVTSTDSRAHDLAANYIIPSPVWKSSYRLIFGDGAQPTLEGWAIVDNTTGEDWTDVRMSLVSGKPISFISALYEPKYVQRLTGELAQDRPVAPTVYSGNVAAEGSGVGGGSYRAMGKNGVIGGLAGAPPAPMVNGSLEHFARLGQTQESTVTAPAEGGTLGELFEYRIAAPVTIRKNESAMLPFLQQKINARKLLVYSDQSSRNPLQAAELTNSTGKTLDGGPITVFDGGAYGGEALVETFKSADKRLISYAVDLGTRITTAFDTKNALVREVHASRGVITARMAAAETKVYTIRNVDPKGKTLIVEHAVRPQYTLLSPSKAAETSATAYRFEVPLPPDSTTRFPVSEERVFLTTVMLSNLTPDLLSSYADNKILSEANRRQLQQVLDAKREVANLDSQIRARQTNIDNLNHDQERLRQNITTLNNVSGQQQQVQSYAARMAAQETRMAALGEERSQLQQRHTSAQAALDNLLEKIEF